MPTILCKQYNTMEVPIGLGLGSPTPSDEQLTRLVTEESDENLELNLPQLKPKKGNFLQKIFS